jgi:hypothetical protein
MGVHAAATRIDPRLGEIDRLAGPDDANPDMLTPRVVLARPRTVEREGHLGIWCRMIVAGQHGGFAHMEGAKRRRKTEESV